MEICEFCSKMDDVKNLQKLYPKGFSSVLRQLKECGWIEVEKILVEKKNGDIKVFMHKTCRLKLHKKKR